MSDTFDGVLSQEYSNFEFVVVNDGSTDPATVSKLHSYSDSRIVVVHQENKGFTRAIKRAIACATGEFIAIHGSGDISHPTRLTRQVAKLVDNQHAAAVGCGTVQVAANAGFRKRYFAPEAKCTAASLRDRMPFVHGTTMMRASSYNRAGGYDERFHYCADWDLFFRLLEVGEILAVPEGLYEQRMFSDGFSFSPDHKFKQLWFRDLATSRSNKREELLDNAAEYTDSIDKNDPKYAKYTAISSIKAIAKGDFNNGIQWLRLFRCQCCAAIRKYLLGAS